MIDTFFLLFGLFIVIILVLIRLLPSFGRLFAQGFQEAIKEDLQKQEDEFVKTIKTGGRNFGKEKKKL